MKKIFTMKRTVLFFAVLLLVTTAKSQDTVFVRQTIQDLSSPAFHGRGLAFGGDSIAADYLEKKLQELGALPFDGKYSQHYKFNGFAMEGGISVRLGNNELKQNVDYQFATYSKSVKSRRLRVIEIHPAMLNNEHQMKAFCHAKKNILKSSFVYIEGALDANKYDKTTLKNINRIHNENVLGCRGYILGCDKFPTMSVSGNTFVRDYSVIYIKDSLMKNTFDNTTFPRNKNSLGTFLDITFNNRFFEHTARNVAGYIKGTENPDSLYVFTAHYDHIGTMGKILYPGAHDNASGTAAVLDLVRYFRQHPPKYSVAFVFFSAEESGLFGSQHFVKNPMFDISKVKLLVNIDMFCGGDDGLMIFNAMDEKTRDVCERFKVVNEKEKLVKEVVLRKNSPNSDHYYFSELCPAIFILSMGGEFGGYHDPFDTCERCQIKHYDDMFRLLLHSISLE